LLLSTALLSGGEPPKPAPPEAKPARPPYEPTSHYEDRQIEGWCVRVNKGFLRDRAELAGETLKLMAVQLYQIRRVVPAAAVAKLQRITIWVEYDEPHHPCMAYHPDRNWLREHGMNPDKARCVEVADARNFLRWTLDQPWMVLHELAHGYHDRFLGGYDNPEIAAAYKAAMKDKLYNSVLRINNKTERAYATTNPMEYFAETTEAYFGTNDFYPFVRAELKQHDPRMYGLLRKLWGAGRHRVQESAVRGRDQGTGARGQKSGDRRLGAQVRRHQVPKLHGRGHHSTNTTAAALSAHCLELVNSCTQSQPVAAARRRHRSDALPCLTGAPALLASVSASPSSALASVLLSAWAPASPAFAASRARACVFGSWQALS
jgi:hypothetical protein